ncbi:MAG TPA: glycosyltransferase family 2 protein [Mycobacteriales bacterium]|nr:glycosyltransferase family 2 protein [Mycobacteriales bacterium]
MTGALVSAARHAVLVVNWIVLGYFLLSNGFQAVLMTAAATDIRHRARAGWSEQLTLLLSSPAAPTVSVLAPAHNEAATIAASVRALLALRYPRLQVVVINDGSTDGTLEALRHQFALVPVHPILRLSVPTAAVRGLYHSLTAPALLVVDKANGGKADALNAGVNAAAGELLCAIDADTLIEPDALLRVVRPFLGRGDVVASGGTIRVANDCVVRSGRVVTARAPRRLLPGVQAVEYLRAFLFGRLGWNRLGGNLIISGAFGLFRRDAVLTAGGYAADTVGEDMELVVRLRRRGIEAGGPAEVVFVPDPVAWTEVPESVRVLGRQRDRWQRGLADVLVRHRRLIGNPRYGALGRVPVLRRHRARRPRHRGARGGRAGARAGAARRRPRVHRGLPAGHLRHGGAAQPRRHPARPGRVPALRTAAGPRVAVRLGLRREPRLPPAIGLLEVAGTGALPARQPGVGGDGQARVRAGHRGPEWSGGGRRCAVVPLWHTGLDLGSGSRPATSSGGDPAAMTRGPDREARNPP